MLLNVNVDYGNKPPGKYLLKVTKRTFQQKVHSFTCFKKGDFKQYISKWLIISAAPFVVRMSNLSLPGERIWERFLPWGVNISTFNLRLTNAFSSNLNTINLNMFHNHGGIYRVVREFNKIDGEIVKPKGVTRNMRGRILYGNRKELG